MSFVTILALGIAALIALPYLAHRLRRLRADERPFAPAKLVDPAPPRARRRSQLEDRALFGTRAAAIIALALLGASPLVRCSRLSMQRSQGASVALAIVVDDSMSMRAPRPNAKGTRFARAKEAALELLASARDGDAVAIVLAGAPPRVALAATTDLGSAKAAIDALTPSDRATDLDSALRMAETLVLQLPQVDKRIVLMTDMADGNPEGTPLGEGARVTVWAPLTELEGDAADCAVMRADLSGTRASVHVACAHGGSAEGREISIVDAKGTVLAHAPAPPGSEAEVSIAGVTQSPPLWAKLGGADGIAEDDVAPMMLESTAGAMAVIIEAADETAVTGGAPVLEQALAALRIEMTISPLPALPDRRDDMTSFLGIIVDDPSGFTPEQRRALGSFLDEGGVVLIALGPRAASAPLGATLEPVLTRSIIWSETPVPGADPSTAKEMLSASIESAKDLGAKKRAILASDDVKDLDVLASWKDGAPLVGRRGMGRGEAWLVTLPFALDQSDLPLRPMFLTILDAFVERARTRAIARRADVGVAWAVDGARSVRVTGPDGAQAMVVRDGKTARVTPGLSGSYDFVIDGKNELRVASPPRREIDLRPRKRAPGTTGSAVGDTHAQVDISSSVALALLVILAIELFLRLRAPLKAEA